MAFLPWSVPIAFAAQIYFIDSFSLCEVFDKSHYILLFYAERLLAPYLYMPLRPIFTTFMQFLLYG